MLISGILTSGSIIWMLGRSIIPRYAVRTCRMRCTNQKPFNLTLVGYLLKGFPLFSCLRSWWVLFHDWTSIYNTSRQTGKVIRCSHWDILGCKLYSASTIKHNDKSGNKSRLTLIWRDAVAQWFPTFFDAFLPLLILELFIPPLLHNCFFHFSPITRVCKNILSTNILFLLPVLYLSWCSLVFEIVG